MSVKKEVVFIFNTSNCDVKVDYILVDCQLNRGKKWMECVYGKKNKVEIIVSENPANPICFIKVHLQPMELIILKNY